MGKREDKMMAEIAKLLGTTTDEVNELKKAGRDIYSQDERVLQYQSIINFYRARILPETPRQRQGETSVAFAKRKADFDAAYDEWRFRECEGCHEIFAYAYTYDGVKFCSLNCLEAELSKIGLHVTVGRDLRQRWGLYHPAIVPSSVIEGFRRLFQHLDESFSDPEKTDHHTPHLIQGIDWHKSSNQDEQDNLNNTA